jgi:hypothetical protein
LPEPWTIEDWDAINMFTLRHQTIKHQIIHPYATENDYCDISRLITVEVTGETKNDVPHGLCSVKFIYNGELNKSGTYSKPEPKSDDPFLDG